MASDATPIPEEDDRDSLDSLKISRLPVSHPALRKARVVKNGRLDSVIELYRDRSTGSGQYAVEDIASTLGITTSGHPDIIVLRYVGLLPAFDVFSIRLLLRELGAQSNTMTALAPSPEIANKLEAHMRKFTLPLLRYVYGNEALEMGNLRQLIDAFVTPDIASAQAHLKRLADKLDLKIQDVPRFLEDYSDTFLAIALYELTLDQLKPPVEALLGIVKTLAADVQFRNNTPVRTSLAAVEMMLPLILSSAAKRLGAAEKVAENLWANHSGSTLRSHQIQIREFQMLIGYILCGVSAKMTAWNNAFPPNANVSTSKRAAFIASEVVHALTHLSDAALKGTRAAGYSTDALKNLGKDRNDTFRSYLRNMEPPQA